MSKAAFSKDPSAQGERMKRFYRRQARVYDTTRWSFLFGRASLLRHVQLERADAVIVEVGCGTGFNLKRLGKRFPQARLMAFDVSADMLAVAGRNLERAGVKAELIHRPYGPGALAEPADLILFSYSLTMINPQWESLILQAHHDLKPGGCIAVVDFHNTRSKLLRGHMTRHHVRMDAHLLPVLSQHFKAEYVRIGRAYLGWWQWLEFIGRK